MGVGWEQERVRLAKFLHTLEVFKENQLKTLHYGYCGTKKLELFSFLPKANSIGVDA